MSKSRKGNLSAQTFSRGPSLLSEQPTLKDWHCVAILAALTVIFFHKILLGQAYFWEDFLYQNFPFRSFAATSLAMGQMPLWNPYTFNGMPFLADIQTTVLYLPTLLLTLFVSNGSLSYYWLEVVIILHFVLAGVGMFYLAKSFGLHNVPSLFAGAAYMLSGYMIVHAIHQQNVTLVAWYPLIMLFFRKALMEQRWLFVFVCGLTLGHSILAGYPQLSLYIYFFLGLYFLFELLTTFTRSELLSRPSLVMTSKAAVIVVISVALAMIQLLPTFELSALSERAQITFEKASEGSLAWSQLATLFFPKMFGSAAASGFEYFGPGQYFYYWETCVYLGVLPLLLGVLSVSAWKNKHVKFLWGMAIFSLLFALGDNFVLFRVFFDFVPGFSKFRIPARMGIFLTLAIALLSAFSLQQLLYEKRESADRKTQRNVLLGVVALGALLYALISSGSFAGSMSGASFRDAATIISKGITPSLLLLLASGGVLFVLIVKGMFIRFAGLIILLLFFLDVFVFGGNQNNAEINPNDYFNRQSTLAEFLKNDGKQELFRINTRNSYGILPGWDRNQGMVDRIFMLEGYTPLTLQRKYAPVASPDVLYDLLNVKYKTVFDEKTGQQNFVEHPNRMPRAFFLYDTHVARSEQELLDFIKSPVFNHRTTAVLEKELGTTLASPSAPPKWNARITHYTNNEIAFDASTSHDGLLVLSEMHYPGWKAFVDGIETEIYRTDYNLRSVFVPAGEHKIEMQFAPSSFRNGMWISITALTVCVAGITLSVGRKKAST
ncbi:MAG: YfhO family protein [Ignavibacteriae bacterium]|nr:YfhO family protein [Ignavibacteriota bacterium]